MFLDRVIRFGETLGDQVKGHSPKKLESLIEVPNEVHVKVHVLTSMRSLSYLRSVFLHRVIHLLENLRDKVRVRSPKKLKKNNRGSLKMSSESTCFWLQYDPSLISVTCS